MTVSLSIKDVPEDLAARLRQRAARNHRSLQRELMALIEAATEPPLVAGPAGADGGTPVNSLPRSGTAPGIALLAMEREAAYALAAAHTVLPSAAPGIAPVAVQALGIDLPPAQAGAEPGQLLAELDAIVAGSRFGSAPMLPREHLHDRALARELEFECHAEPGSRPGR